MKHRNFVYILTTNNHSVLYTGVTSNLEKRLNQHMSGYFPDAFTSRYHVNILAYFEEFENIEDAIAREKQIKAGSRKKKIDLINHINPEWKDLSEMSFIGFS